MVPVGEVKATVVPVTPTETRRLLDVNVENALPPAPGVKTASIECRPEPPKAYEQGADTATEVEPEATDGLGAGTFAQFVPVSAVEPSK